MKLASVFVVILSMTCYFNYGIEASFTNFNVKSTGVCNNTQRKVKHFIRFDMENGKQYMTHNLTLPFPVGDNFEAICLIQTKTVGNQFVELFTIREKNGCSAFNKYMGEFLYDIERESGITPGVCPMQQGRYHGNHIQMHYEKITLQTFPFGTLKITMSGIDKSSKECIWCVWFIIENIVN